MFLTIFRLHHMVMMNQGPRRWDPVGVENAICVPFVVSGTSPSRAERYFVTGNERTPFNYYVDGIEKAAYHLDPEDKFGFILELMNMNMQDELVYSMSLTPSLSPTNIIHSHTNL